MPTYDYKCKACGHLFETMHGMTAPVLRKCPKCGKLKLERLISGGAGVIFKGSGFYETDYKQNRRGSEAAKSDFAKDKASDAAPEAAKPDAKPAADSGAKSDSKQDAKPAAKPEPKPKKDSGSKKD